MMPGRSNSVNLEASASNREVAELSCENTCLPCVLVCVERDTGVPLSVRVTLAFGAAAGHAEPARVKTPIPIGYPPSQLTLIYNLLLVSCTTLLRLCQSFSIQRRAPRGHIPTPGSGHGRPLVSAGNARFCGLRSGFPGPGRMAPPAPAAHDESACRWPCEAGSQQK